MSDIIGQSSSIFSQTETNLLFLTLVIDAVVKPLTERGDVQTVVYTSPESLIKVSDVSLH